MAASFARHGTPQVVDVTKRSLRSVQSGKGSTRHTRHRCLVLPPVKLMLRIRWLRAQWIASSTALRAYDEARLTLRPGRMEPVQLISIFRIVACDEAIFGKVSVSTPLSNFASAWSTSTSSGSGIVRMKLPCERSSR
jgi:hypothetical protein